MSVIAALLCWFVGSVTVAIVIYNTVGTLSGAINLCYISVCKNKIPCCHECADLGKTPGRHLLLLSRWHVLKFTAESAVADADADGARLQPR